MKRPLPLTMLALAASAVACQPPTPPASAPPPAAISVVTAPADVIPMPKSLALTGSLVANRRSDVAANAAGLVVRTFVERGSSVDAGAPLIQLDTRGATLAAAEARANLRNAEALLDLANAACARNEALLQKNVIPLVEGERARSQCQTGRGTAEAARARAEMAVKQLGDATIRAPFAGTIGDRLVNVGEYVQPPTKVAVLVELSPLRLQFGLDETHIGRVREGQEVSFEVEAFPEETFTGIVRYLDPAVHAMTRHMTVEAVVDNADRRLRAGMFVTARLQLPDAPAVTVPKGAIAEDASASRVFVVADDVVEERIVQVGAERDGRVAVLEGLRGGERVVVHPGEQVKDGVPVR